MSLTVFNSQSGQKEVFTPLQPDTVKMYVCGPTVYNRVHIGNARPAVVFDTLFRLLKTLYGDVQYARNITDIDDKIMQAAREQGETIEAVSSRYTQAYIEDMAALNNLEPTVMPFATQHISEMIAMVGALVEKGHAYEAEGHVLFAVKSMADYGKLSKRSLEDMLAGARVEVADYKKYAGDFVLWKPSSEDEPGWESPWGRGRPGWHLECSAMIEKHLGTTIDIHGGGIDLQFPHHENEIAQSQCAHGGETFVRYWMHNAYINIDGEKMSKSLGNFKMVKDLLSHYHGEVLRFAILSAHYRTELNFSTDALDNAKRALDRLYGYRQLVDMIPISEPATIRNSAAYQALLDDLNTPLAISELHGMGKAIKTTEGEEQQQLASRFIQIANLMGILQQNPDDWFKGDQGEEKGGLSKEQVEEKIAAMQAARADKDYALADQIRDELASYNIQLTRDGWRRA